MYADVSKRHTEVSYIWKGALLNCFSRGIDAFSMMNKIIISSCRLYKYMLLYLLTDVHVSFPFFRLDTDGIQIHLPLKPCTRFVTDISVSELSIYQFLVQLNMPWLAYLQLQPCWSSHVTPMTRKITAQWLRCIEIIYWIFYNTNFILPVYFRHV